jgi:hypothetical protein
MAEFERENDVRDSVGTRDVSRPPVSVERLDLTAQGQFAAD